MHQYNLLTDEELEVSQTPVFPFYSKINLDFQVGRFTIKTVSQSAELSEVLRLRYQVFQVETVGTGRGVGLDYDQFDVAADHILIRDTRSQEVVATCRLNCSAFTNKFYSEQEFACGVLLGKPGVKLEVGRVCVHKKYRNGATLFMLWKAIAEYMKRTQAETLFGCGSIMTQSPEETLAVYRYLHAEGKIRYDFPIYPTHKYRFLDFEELLLGSDIDAQPITERESVARLIPPLCNLYFDIGCYVPGPPAIDRDFKCIDFLTVLELNELDSRIKKRIFGDKP
ncbi:MAG: GNAT family N-acetyltransferase [Xanthomonadaceae bacterium]|nr:GNAT family N-acetyltransferase [Xanthomonadaceae bacterium]